MGRSSRYRRKRKPEESDDSSSEDSVRSVSRSAEKKVRRSDRKKPKEKSPSAISSQKNSEGSMSVEETNKLRASLGLAPLEVDDGSKEREVVIEDGVAKVYKEDGMEFVHKKAEHMGDKKRTEEMAEKLQVMRDKRRLYDKLLHVKRLAASDSDEDAESWVNKSRKLEEERKRAEERAKILDDMDADFGVDALLKEEKKKAAKRSCNISQNKTDLAGLVVGHATEDFLEGSETVLVLDDKDVLHDGDEVLINPNLVENRRHQKNAELRKRKGHYEAYSEEFDDFGMPKEKNLLSKYDEELEGEAMKTFRLNEIGEVDVEKERHELETRKKLLMANKKLESLDTPEYTVASEFYTPEEMLSFRKPKSKKERNLRKRKEKMLKADDLIPDEPTQAENAQRAARVAARQLGEASVADKSIKTEVEETNLEDGELDDDEDKKNWRTLTTGGLVNIQNLNYLATKVEEEDEDDDEDLIGGVDLSAVVIEDDAEEELTAVLDKTRKLKQYEVKNDNAESSSALKVHEMLKTHQIKEEPVDVDEKSGVIIDSTMEYCRNLGDIPTYGLAGNRKDAIDVRELKEAGTVKPETDSDDNDKGDQDLQSRFSRSRKKSSKALKGRWFEATATTAAVDDSAKRKDQSSGSEESDEDSHYVLGEERDVTKGVAAMLKSAAEKGYLETGKERRVNGPSLKHLESKRFSQIEVSKYDIEEKYTKKLERMGTTGTGPIRPFPEKTDYKPDIRINYVDERGKEMESKDAFRVLSWKFHGKGPGKKQIEKRQAKQEKKELLKKMNSMDTPLGTLNKQLRKQKALQTPYIVLSGSGRDTGAPLKKD